MSDKNNIEIIENSIAKTLSKEFKVYFFAPYYQDNVVSVYEIFNHAQTLKKAGYDVKILTDEVEYKKPEWFEAELVDIEVVFVGDEKNSKKLRVAPEDFVIIPETLTNVMEVFKNLSCNKIILLQTFDGAIGSLAGGLSYNNFNIQNVLTTSDTVKEMANEYLGSNLNVKTYKLGIPDYFKKPSAPKQPKIGFFSRNASDVTKVVKMFYNKYPSLRWITFEDLKNRHRKDFADTLSECFMVIWLDRLASHGTVSLEAMKVGTVVAGIVPDILPAYINKDNGLWSDQANDIPNIIGEVAMRFLEDDIPAETFAAMDKTAGDFNMESSRTSIVSAYEEFIQERITLLEKLKTHEQGKSNK